MLERGREGERKRGREGERVCTYLYIPTKNI